MLKRLFCHHKYRLAFDTRPYSNRTDVGYQCIKCGKLLILNCNYQADNSKHIWVFDGYKNMDTRMYHCKHCGRKIEIDVV